MYDGIWINTQCLRVNRLLTLPKPHKNAVYDASSICPLGDTGSLEPTLIHFSDLSNNILLQCVELGSDGHPITENETLPICLICTHFLFTINRNILNFYCHKKCN